MDRLEQRTTGRLFDEWPRRRGFPLRVQCIPKSLLRILFTRPHLQTKAIQVSKMLRPLPLKRCINGRLHINSVARPIVLMPAGQ